MVLDGRGSQLGVMVSDVDVKDRRRRRADRRSESTTARPRRPGIKAGDVVVEYDGERVRSARQFTRLVQETPEGRTVEIGLMRDGKKPDGGCDAGEQRDDAGTSDPTSTGDARSRTRPARVPLQDARPSSWRLDRDREPRRFEYRLPGGMMPFITAREGVSV